MRSGPRRWGPRALALLLLAVGAALLGLGLRELAKAGARQASAPGPTATEPILPGPPTAASSWSGEAQSTGLPGGEPGPGLFTARERLGVGIGDGRPAPKAAGQLGFGWYLDWAARPERQAGLEAEYVPMIHLNGGDPTPKGKALRQAVEALPGSLWIIGNEPDVEWQDNVAPDAYAQAYHDLYYELKGLDPTCQVAIGGVSQPTALRLRYLDAILAAYQARYGEPMPVDVWNVHNFILREERGGWGVGMPPGSADLAGELRQVDDHDRMDLFRQQIVEFRRWMAERGEQNKPLIVSEYGILMPAEYGFPLERVRRFMLATFEYLRTAADPDLGYPADGYRLVQRWCWFSLADSRYPTGDLLTPDGNALSPLGESFRDYVLALR